MESSKCTYNLGLVQVLSGSYSAAQTTLACAPQTPETQYLMAICGARSNNSKLLYEYLMKAVSDPKLKEKARTDLEFYKYSKTPEFQAIVK